MRKAQGWFARTACIAAMAAAVSGTLPSQGSQRGPLNKIKIMGELTVLRDGKGNWTTGAQLLITKDGKPVPGLVVRVEGHLLSLTPTGWYICPAAITDFKPAAGMKLNFSISSGPVPPPQPAAKISIVGSAMIGALIKITQPASGSQVTLASVGVALPVCWQGGQPPFRLDVVKLSGNAVLGIYTKTLLAGGCHSVPAAVFAAGTKCEVDVSCKMDPFAISVKELGAGLAFDNSSHVALSCRTCASITML